MLAPNDQCHRSKHHEHYIPSKRRKALTQRCGVKNPLDLKPRQNRCSDYHFVVLRYQLLLRIGFSGSTLPVTTDNLRNTITSKQTWYTWVHLPLYRDDNNVVLSGQSEIKQNGANIIFTKFSVTKFLDFRTEIATAGKPAVLWRLQCMVADAETNNWLLQASNYWQYLKHFLDTSNRFGFTWIAQHISYWRR